MDAQKDATKDETRLAEERTDLAYHRTLLANERTFSAWVRTGLTAVAAGLGIAQFLQSPAWSPATRVIGAIFIVFGGGTFFLGLCRYFSQYRRLTRHDMKLTPIWVLTIFMLALLSATAIALMLVFS